MKDVKLFAAEEPFEVEGVKFNAGSFLIPSSGNSADLLSQLKSATASLGLRPHAVGSEIKVKRHAVSVPRIALLHTWVNTQNDGWFRLALDECEVPYSYISDQDVRATPDLKAKYDVIIFPPVTSSLPDPDQRRPQAPARRRLRLRRPGPIQVHRADPEPGRRRRLRTISAAAWVSKGWPI